MNLTSQYSSALVSIATEEKIIDQMVEHAKLVRDSINSPELLKIISSYELEKQEKDKLIEKIYGDLNLNVVNTIKLMIDKRHSKFIFGVFKKVVTEINKLKGISEGYIYTTEELSEKNIKLIESKIAEKVNKKISLSCLIDKQLISGIKVEVADQVFDYSAKGRLNIIKEDLLKEDN